VTGQDAIALLIVLAVAAAVIWVDWRCLSDLARTPERELRYFNRALWALIILITFPLGPMAYLTFAKGPRRF
jgi:hypothetical protein